MKKTLISLGLALGMSCATNAFAGNIFLTGHDDDFHRSADAQAAFDAALSFVRAGSTLPVLSFDSGSELQSLLTGAGVAFTNVDPNGGVAASLFNTSTFSAFIVASDSTCGGCDNSTTGEANINANSSAINDFLNAGGGIIGLSGAGNSATYYSFLPESAGIPPVGAPSTGYFATAAGTMLGIGAVNGDATHNEFLTPGSVGGPAAAYVVTEQVTNFDGSIGNESLACISCTTSGGVLTSSPEPGSIMLMVGGLGALISIKRRFLA